MGPVLAALVLAHGCLGLAAAQELQETPYSHCASLKAASFGEWLLLVWRASHAVQLCAVSQPIIWDPAGHSARGPSTCGVG